MKYELIIGDKTYSSWSLRGWLLFAKFDIPVKTHNVRMYSEGFHTKLAEFKPARLVPAMKFDGTVVTDSLAMAETLAEQNPDKQMWPADPKARALARSLVAEMHSGFTDMRNECTANLRRHYLNHQPSNAVLADIEHMELLWITARRDFGGEGPWLFGEYSIADVFFAPAVTRFATYNFPRGEIAQSYIDAHLADLKFRQWRAMGLAQNYIQPGYDKDLAEGEWPGPIPLPATPVDNGPSENTHCPYSGDPVTDYLELDGRVFGFCNPYCRDRTVADAEIWPEFTAIYQK